MNTWILSHINRGVGREFWSCASLFVVSGPPSTFNTYIQFSHVQKTASLVVNYINDIFIPCLIKYYSIKPVILLLSGLFDKAYFRTLFPALMFRSLLLTQTEKGFFSGLYTEEGLLYSIINNN